MAERDEKGRFIKGSAAAFGARGGRARAARLTPEERVELARLGLQAVADRYFGGDVIAAQAWLAVRGGKARGRAALRDREKGV